MHFVPYYPPERLGWFLGTLRWTRRAAACDVVHCQSGEALPVVLASRLAEAGRETIARRFGLERQIGEYLDYYETLAKGKR